MFFCRPPARLPSITFRTLRRQFKFHPTKRPFSLSFSFCALEMATVNTSERLAKLRQLMEDHKVDVYSMSMSFYAQ